jgi:hypothetical protein
MRGNLTGMKKDPHPELVEGRNGVDPVLLRQLLGFMDAV